MSGTKSGCLGVLVRLGRCLFPSAMLRQILLKGLNATHSPCLPTILLSATRTPPLTYSPNHRRKDRHHLWPAIGMRNCTSLHHVRLLSGRAGRQRRLRTSTRRVRSALRIPRKYHEHNTEGKERFVVPNWAKTQTVTVPRLSEEAAAKLEAA